MSNQFLNVMDAETGSTNTSVDDKTDDFCENPTRDSIAEGLMSLLKPTVDQLDEVVRSTRFVCTVKSVHSHVLEFLI